MKQLLISLTLLTLVGCDSSDTTSVFDPSTHCSATNEYSYVHSGTASQATFYSNECNTMTVVNFAHSGETLKSATYEYDEGEYIHYPYSGTPDAYVYFTAIGQHEYRIKYTRDNGVITASASDGNEWYIYDDEPEFNKIDYLLTPSNIDTDYTDATAYAAMVGPR